MDQRYYGLRREDIKRVAFQLPTRNGLKHQFNQEKSAARKKWLRSFFKNTSSIRGQLKCDGTHAQKPHFVFRRNGRVHLNRRRHQFSRLLAVEVCASPIVMLDTPCSEVVWRVLATHSIRHFPLHFLSRASPCAITFQLDSNYDTNYKI